MLTKSDLLSKITSSDPRWRLVAAQAAEGGEVAQYFSHPRPDVVDVVPVAARSILELGCGAGLVGAAVKQRQDCSYVGIEVNEHAALVAAPRLDAVLVGDVESGPLPLPDGSADCLVCADVLEHLSDPWRMLRELRRVAQPGGTLVASVPNIQHADVLEALVHGRWDYVDAGILDRTHLRFFTRSTFAEALAAGGWTVTQCSYTLLPQHSGLVNGADQTPKTVRLGRMVLENLSPVELMELVAYQWIFVATATPAADG